MRKTFASSAFVLFLSGCALPVPLQIASWALDGLSVLTTQKSVADHAISLVAEKDCAIWRGLTEGEVCRDIDDNTTTAIADASETSKPDDFSTETIAFNEFQYADAAGIDELPGFDTASGSPLTAEDLEVASLPAQETAADNSDMIAAVQQDPQYVFPVRPQLNPVNVAIIIDADTDASETVGYNASILVPEQPIQKIEAVQIVAQQKTVSLAPNNGIYYVIGSFRSLDNAMRMQGMYANLLPKVLTAKATSNSVFRVVVGPTNKQTMKKVHNRIYKSGIADTWAIRVSSDDWQLAGINNDRPELASIAD